MILSVIARSVATKQSILCLRREMDCFAALAMTGWDHHYFPLSRCFIRGSSASRAASPIRLTLRMAIDSNRPGQKISEGFIRFSAGLEHVDDLIEDFAAALEQA